MCVCVCMRVDAFTVSTRASSHKLLRCSKNVQRYWDHKQCKLQLEQAITQVQQRNMELENANLEAVADKVPKMKHKHHFLPQANTAKALNSKEGRQLAVGDTVTIQKVNLPLMNTYRTSSMSCFCEQSQHHGQHADLAVAENSPAHCVCRCSTICKTPCRVSR